MSWSFTQQALDKWFRSHSTTVLSRHFTSEGLTNVSKTDDITSELLWYDRPGEVWYLEKELCTLQGLFALTFGKRKE